MGPPCARTFPIVGRLKEDTYMYQNQAYHLTQHGFARDQVFDVIEKGGEEVSFSLKSTKGSRRSILLILN